MSIIGQVDGSGTVTVINWAPMFFAHREGSGSVAKGETELQMVQRHVREGEAHVQRQREVVTKMWERGAPTDIAVTLLEAFQDTLRQHKAHLVRLEAMRDDADSA
jgi:ATP-dependent protease HslVU (ClpYQ) peptidase subunit